MSADVRQGVAAEEDSAAVRMADTWSSLHVALHLQAAQT